MKDSPRVVLLALDGLPSSALKPSITPNLWQLGREGGIRPEGGRSSLPSTTYPGFASLLTGATPARTGIRTTSRRDGAVPGWAGADVTLVPTIVHAAADAGLAAGVVMGDHKLQRVLRLTDISGAWPPRGEVPQDAALDSHGYPTNAALRDRVVQAALDPDLDLLFVHLNETDTLAHDLGPQARETITAVREADAIVGEVMEALRPDWDRAILAVTSDHDMTARLPLPAIDPTASPDCAGLVDDWITDGCAAWVRIAPGADAHLAVRCLSNLEGVEAWRWRKPNIMLLLAEQGRTFESPWIPRAGVHGSLCTARTLAIVGGGHPAVPSIAMSIAVRAPRIQDWAPTLAAVLGIELPDADGFDMLSATELRQAM